MIFVWFMLLTTTLICSRMRTWRSRLAVLLAFAATVVVGLLIAVTIGGMLAGFVG